MIIEKVAGNISEIKSEKQIIEVDFEWFEAEKKRIKKYAKDGREFGICISEILNDGDILLTENDKIYVVKIIPTDLIKIYANSMQEMGRICFELGNRHLSLKIENDFVCIPYEKTIWNYLSKLGFGLIRYEGVFAGYIGCKAHETVHSHSHSHGHTHSHN